MIDKKHATTSRTAMQNQRRRARNRLFPRETHIQMDLRAALMQTWNQGMNKI